MAVVALALVGVSASSAQEGPLASACGDAPQGRFGDVAGVHEAGIDCIGWWGVTQGTGDGSYLPGDPVNRAQMATFVARAIELSGGVLPADPPTAFGDTAGNVHAGAIDALAAIEVVGGVGAGLYAPDRRITRGQMATFLAGAWEARTGEQLASGEVLFDDIEGNAHAGAIAAITAVGWTGGTGPGVYEPGLPVTRAQMGTFLARWLTSLVEDGHADYPPANPVPIPERPEPQPDPPVTGAQQWQRLPHDAHLFDDAVMFAVTTGGPGLVAVGRDAGGTPVWTSSDGQRWQQAGRVETPFNGTSMFDVTTGGPGLVSVGRDWGGAAVWTSSDGVDWQRVAHDEAVFGGELTVDILSVTAGGPGLVAVGVDGDWRVEEAAAVWTSPDGLSWQRVAHDQAAFSDAVMTSVTTGGPGLVAVGYDTELSGPVVWTSSDGRDWQRVAHDPAAFGDGVMNAVTAGGPGLVAVGRDTDGAAVWTSPDGLTWRRIAHDETVFGGTDDGGSWMQSVTSGGPGLVAVGLDGSGAAVWTSSDGFAWQRVSHDEGAFGPGDWPGRLSMNSVTVSGSGLVAVGGDAHEHLENVAAVWTSQ